MDTVEMPSVENLVGLLSLYAPSTLETLRNRHQNVDIFIPGTVLGLRISGGWKARLDTTLVALRKMGPLIEPATDKLHRRLKAAGRFELGGEFVGAIGSSGVCAILWGGQATAGTNNGNNGALIAAFIALAGTIAALIVRFMRKDIFGSENAVFKQYEELRDSAWNARVLLAQLTGLSDADEEALENDEIRKLIEQADALAGRIYRVLRDLRIDVQLSD